LLTRPFLKWAGGKRSVLQQLKERMPASSSYSVYHEPFVGGGALFFEVQPRQAFLSDINFNLILTLQAIKDNANGVIKDLKNHVTKHNKDYYIKAREKLNTSNLVASEIAALFIYLNKTCYNGLYRVNKAGKFNVPMGSYKNPTILDEKNLLNVSKVLQNADIKHQSFIQTTIRRGDFYYLDPPYHNTYDGYNGQGFSNAEHEELAALCQQIDKEGGLFMLSNSDTEFVYSLYDSKFIIENVQAFRMISCKGHQRGRTNELIIRNYQ